MFHSLTLPPYDSVKHFDGKGNFAVKKYYKFPFRFFYRMKLQLILGFMQTDLLYRNILDFGAGPARIFRTELRKRSLAVTSAYNLSDVDMRSKYELIICASVLEFVHHPAAVIGSLSKLLAPGCSMIVASPCDSWLTTLYFQLIGDKHTRTSNEEIIATISDYFTITRLKRWFGLYYVLEATPK